MAAPPAKSTPKDAQVMASILKDIGVPDYEPRVINQMLEFSYRYITDILDDAKVYSTHAGKKTIDTDDVKLAIQCRMDHSFTTPPPRDLLMDIARHKNSQPLPAIQQTGPRLPPDRYCLSATNYRLKPLKKPRVQLNMPSNPITISSPRVLSTSVGGGSVKGTTFNLTSGSLSVVTKGVSMPTVKFVTKTATPSSSSPMPTIRLSSGVSSGQTSLVNPLKRKMEDDDYDNV